MKYVIVEVSGVPAAIVFADHVQHKDVVRPGQKVFGAGIASLDRFGGVICGGHSESLGVVSRLEDDAQIIAHQLQIP